MFEKLKEYGLYIVLGLIALGALAYAFLSTSNAQKGGEVVSKIQDKLVTAIAKNQKVKDKTTIVDHLGDLKGLTIGSYKLDETKVKMLNTNGDDVVTSGTTTLDLPASADTTEAGKLQLVMMTNKTIAPVPEGSYDIITKKAGAEIAGTDGFKNLNEQLRGYLATGYVGFGTFKEEKDAKEFRDSYFSTGMIVSKSATGSVVMIEIAR